MAITVRAKELGYYGMERRDPGVIFEIKDDADFSSRWMERVKTRPVDMEEDSMPAEVKPTGKVKRESDKLKI